MKQQMSDTIDSDAERIARELLRSQAHWIVLREPFEERFRNAIARALTNYRSCANKSN